MRKKLKEKGDVTCPGSSRGGSRPRNRPQVLWLMAVIFLPDYMASRLSFLLRSVSSPFSYCHTQTQHHFGLEWTCARRKVPFSYQASDGYLKTGCFGLAPPSFKLLFQQCLGLGVPHWTNSLIILIWLITAKMTQARTCKQGWDPSSMCLPPNF